jgi:hypothetical protein
MCIVQGLAVLKMAVYEPCWVEICVLLLLARDCLQAHVMTNQLEHCWLQSSSSHLALTETCTIMASM